jgi:hypothetical protein
MQLNNPFPNEVRWLYLYNCFECWQCGGNGNGSGGGGIELHHIYGRMSASALNSAPLCHSCHTKVLHTYEEHQRYLQKTIRFLLSQGYKLTDEDNAFLERVKKDLLGIVV